MPRLLPQRTARFQPLPRAAASFNPPFEPIPLATAYHSTEDVVSNPRTEVRAYEKKRIGADPRCQDPFAPDCDEAKPELKSMSRVTFHSIECPSCSASMSAQLYESVNVSIDPGLKERVLNRTINRVKCPKCGQEIEQDANLLYHDMKKQLMVWLRWDKARDGELPMKDFTLRIVHNYAALTEKIKIFDTEFDDCLIEVLKLVSWPTASSRGNEIRFIGVGQTSQGEHLFFDVTSADGVERFSFPKSDAIRSAPMIAEKAKAAAPLGSWRVVDLDFVLDAFR